MPVFHTALQSASPPPPIDPPSPWRQQSLVERHWLPDECSLHLPPQIKQCLLWQEKISRKKKKAKQTNSCFVLPLDNENGETLEEFMETRLGGLQDSLLPCSMLWSLWSRIIRFKQHCANSPGLGLLHLSDCGPFLLSSQHQWRSSSIWSILFSCKCSQLHPMKTAVYSVKTPSTIPSALNCCLCKTKWMTSIERVTKLKLLVRCCGETMDFFFLSGPHKVLSRITCKGHASAAPASVHWENGHECADLSHCAQADQRHSQAWGEITIFLFLSDCIPLGNSIAAKNKTA